jgi:hypothetical protein
MREVSRKENHGDRGENPGEACRPPSRPGDLRAESPPDPHAAQAIRDAAEPALRRCRRSPWVTGPCRTRRRTPKAPATCHDVSVEAFRDAVVAAGVNTERHVDRRDDHAIDQLRRRVVPLDRPESASDGLSHPRSPTARHPALITSSDETVPSQTAPIATAPTRSAGLQCRQSDLMSRIASRCDQPMRGCLRLPVTPRLQPAPETGQAERTCDGAIRRDRSPRRR